MIETMSDGWEVELNIHLLQRGVVILGKKTETM